MVRFILIGVLLLLVARAFWRVIDGVIEAAGGSAGGREQRGSKPAVKLVRDPVCGTYVSPSSALSLTSGGQMQYFCSEKCRTEFEKRKR